MIAAVVVPVTCISLRGGRDRDHEHHAGERDGAHARNRHAQDRWARGSSDIMLQILIEAVLLAFAGGAMGVASGALVTALLAPPVRDHAAHHAPYMRCSRWLCRAWWALCRDGIRRRARRSSIRWWRCGPNDASYTSAREKYLAWRWRAVWTHRFRSLLTILGIVIGITTVVTVASLLTGLRQGVVVFFQELGPGQHLSSSRPAAIPAARRRRKSGSAGRSARSMRSIIRRSARRWKTYGIDRSSYPPVVDGNPITAQGAGLRNRQHRRQRASRRTVSNSRRAISDAGRLFTPEEDRRAAHVAVLGSSMADALFPGGQRGGRSVHDGWRRVHRRRRLRQGQGRLFRRERPGQRRSTFRCAPRKRATRRSTAT